MRKAGVAALLVVGTLLWTVFGLGLWAERQALDTDEWVDTSGALLESEPIRTAVGLHIVDQLFQSAEVEARLEEVLPPRLDRLAGPAAAGLKEVARRNAPQLLGNALALRAWERANERAHSRLLDIVEGRRADADVSLDLQSLFEQVAESTGLPSGVADRLPPEVASLQIAEPEQLETARDLLDLFKTLVWVLVVLAIAAFAGAVALSGDRRKTLIAVGGCLMFAAIAILAARRLAGQAIVDALADAPNAMPAAEDAWALGTSLLVDVAQGSFLLGLFIVTGAWLAGAGRRATAARRVSAYAMREHPGLVRAGLGVVILLLVIWGPVPWTQRFWTILIFTVAAFAWLEWIRRRTIEEFPEQPPPRIAARMPWRGRGRAAELERLTALRDQGVLDQAEFEREKAALLASG
jgi:Short C-terminal domain